MKIQMEGSIFSFLHFYAAEDRNNFLKKPCLCLHLSNELNTDVGLKFLKSVVNIEPNIVEEAKVNDEVLFFYFTKAEEIDKLINHIIDADWLMKEEAQKLIEFQQTLEFPGKVQKKATIISQQNPQLLSNQAKRIQPVSYPTTTTTTHQTNQPNVVQKKSNQKTLKEAESDDEHHHEDYSDDENSSINNKNKKQDKVSSPLPTQFNLKGNLQWEIFEQDKALKFNAQEYGSNHEKAVEETIKQGNLDLLQVFLGTKAPNGEDYRQITNFKQEIFYREHTQLKSAFLVRLVNMLSPSIERWQYKFPEREIVKQTIALLTIVVREIEFNKLLSNFEKNKEASIIEKENIKKVNDIRTYEHWVRQFLDRNAKSVFDNFLEILNEANTSYVISAIKSKREEAQGAFQSLHEKCIEYQEAYLQLQHEIQAKIQSHRDFVDQLLAMPELLPEAYREEFWLGQFNGVLLPAVHDKSKWPPNPAEMDEVEKLRYKNKFIVYVQDNCVTIYWLNARGLSSLVLTEQDSKDIIPLLPEIDGSSYEHKLINLITTKRNTAFLKAELYQAQMSPNSLIDGKSLLYHALENGQYLTVKLLLLCGADIDFKLSNKKTVYEALGFERAVLEEIKKQDTNDLIERESKYLQNTKKHINEYKNALEEKKNSFFRFLHNEKRIRERGEQVEKYLTTVGKAKALRDDKILYQTVKDDLTSKNYQTGALGLSTFYGGLSKQNQKYENAENYAVTKEKYRDLLVENKTLNQQLVDLEKNLKARDETVEKLKNENKQLSLIYQQTIEQLMNEKKEAKLIYQQTTDRLTNENKELKELVQNMAQTMQQMQQQVRQMQQYFTQQQSTTPPAPGM